MNIIVCFSKPNDVNTIRNLLSHYGYRASFSCMAGRKALEACDKLGSGILITGYRLCDMVCMDLYANIPPGFAMLTLCSPKHWEELPPTGLEVLDMPLRASLFLEKLEAMETGLEQKRRERRQRARLGTAGRSKEDNARILQAKKLLMEQRGYDEPRAHRYLQQMAMQSGQSLAETADKLLISMQMA